VERTEYRELFWFVLAGGVVVVLVVLFVLFAATVIP
jgi:hypothetical protein